MSDARGAWWLPIVGGVAFQLAFFVPTILVVDRWPWVAFLLFAVGYVGSLDFTHWLESRAWGR